MTTMEDVLVQAWKYEELRAELINSGAIPTCGVAMTAAFRVCSQEVRRKGDKCYFHKKKAEGLL